MGGITLTDDEQAAAPEDAPPPHPDHPADAHAPAQRHVRLVFAALVLALLLAALQQTAVVPFLPRIVDELGGGARSVWVVVAPVLAVAVTLPVHGRLGDLRGRKGVFQAALVLFVAASALAGWSRTMDQLIACRALQGVGAAGLLAGAHAITADLVPAPARARFLGVLGAALGAAAVAGPAVGEAVRVSWRWIFYANAPLGLLVLIVVGAGLRPLRPLRPSYADERRRFDVLGALLLGTASTCLVLLATWGGTRYAWDSRVILGLACGAAGTLLLSFAAEHYAAEPLVPLGLARPLLVSGLVGALTGTALYAAAAWLPELLGPRGALPPLVPLAGGIVLGSLVSGQLIARTGHHRIHPVFGCAVAAVGTGLLSRLEPGTPVLDHSVWQAVLGTGVGLALPALVAAVQQAAPRADLGAATAAHFQVRLLGGCLGAAAVSTLAGDGGVQGHGGVTPRFFVVVLVPVLVLGLLLACFLKEKPLVSQNAPTASTASVPAARTAAPDIGPASASDGAVWPSSPYGSGVPVCGAVQHHDGSCVPRAALTLVDGQGRQIGRGASGDDGRYALSVPGPGAYVLIAAAPGHQPQAVSVTVTAGDRPVELDIALGGAGRLTGTVVTADGTPVRDAAVTLTDVRGEVVAATRSGRDGGYVMAALVAGEYTLAAGAPDFRPVALPVSVHASRETRQIIELAGGAMLRGTVRTTGGRIVEDARVTLLDAAGNVVDTLTTGPDGVFRFADLSSGAYTVIASGYPPVATVLQVAGGGRTERDLQLGHGD
ncbi:MFS transporter [Streptomyces sp. NPDC045431]|uniref:MFS transporter n=1 Tax=Streptomyces sp. NPDC045431 TaxID=3155613 RepID=UPI00340A9BE3